MKYQIKRTGKRLPINTQYSEIKLAAREKEIAETIIKEGKTTKLPAIDRRQERIEGVIKESGLNLSPMIIKMISDEFKYTPDTDIKDHEILKKYYQIEDLMKYMIV